VAVEEGVSFIVLLFAYASIRAMRSADPDRFPHGTGKIENFSGFLYGALTVPVGCYILYESVSNLIFLRPPVAFGLTQIPLIPSLIVNIFILRRALRLQQSFESPLVDSYVTDYRLAVVLDFFLISAMAVGQLLSYLGATGPASYVDPLVSLGLSLYMLRVASGHLFRNYRILVDFPLPEKEQLAVIRALVEEFHSYDQLGVIRTRLSGAHRLVEIELFFSGDTAIESVTALTERLQSRLEELLSSVRVIVVVRDSRTFQQG
jgi:divalent metal cation (Fe/Co/Zn/Cd) transporter